MEQSNLRFATGSFSYYVSDRDPTPSEPDITDGYLDDMQLIFCQNATDGTLFYLRKPAVQGELSWARLA